ncbi:hypothetical protein SAMN05444275_105169 [Myroides odoratimimus subsp. xuanwuensis]|nr:hypothetical protein SAMN05444275_105169 [Myroides odoratimimus subsp. xuanwuensis]
MNLKNYKETIIWFGMIRIFIDLMTCIVELKTDQDNTQAD